MSHMTPPALQLPGSRLKTALNARDLEIDMELLGPESLRTQQQIRQMIDDLSNNNNLYNSSSRFGDLMPTNLEDVFGSPDQSLSSQFHGLLSPKVSNPQTLMQSPTTHHQFRQTSSPLRASYPSPNYSSSPVRKPVSYGFDSSAAVAQAIMNARSGSLKQRSQSFIDRAGATMSLRSTAQASSTFSEWGAPDGKLEWGFSGEYATKLRKSASFGYGGGEPVNVNQEPDVSWVNTLVKDVRVERNASSGKYHSGEKLSQWIEQMYIEQEQMVA